MSAQAAGRPGDGPGIPLEGEPVSFFRPLLAGEARPGAVQPAPGPPLLEEEPALWIQMAAEGGETGG